MQLLSLLIMVLISELPRDLENEMALTVCRVMLSGHNSMLFLIEINTFGLCQHEMVGEQEIVAL